MTPNFAECFTCTHPHAVLSLKLHGLANGVRCIANLTPCLLTAISVLRDTCCTLPLDDGHRSRCQCGPHAESSSAQHAAGPATICLALTLIQES